MKKNILLFIFSCTSLIFIFTSFALSAEKDQRLEIEKRLSGTLVLSDLLKYAYISNPSIASSKESWKAFIENYRAGTGYPDPRISMTYFPSPIETRLGPQNWNIALSQPIPFPGRLTRKGKVLEADAKIAKLMLDKTIKKTVTSISSSFYELIYVQKAIKIARANFKLDKELMKISENAYAGDKALFYDVSKARAQTAQIQYDILLLEELEQTEKTRLNTILNREPNARLGRAKDLVFRDVVYSLDEIYKLCLTSEEDILIADEKIKKSNEAIKLSRYDSLPSFKLGLFYASIGEPDVSKPPADAGKDAFGVQFGLSIPIWFGKNHSKISKARAYKRKAASDRIAIGNMIKGKISRLWFKLQNSKRLISLYKKNLIPQAMHSVQTAETWYRQGQGSLSDLFEIQATAYNFQLSLARAKADYGKTLVKLEQFAGVALDNRHEADLDCDLQPQRIKDSDEFGNSHKFNYLSRVSYK